MLDSPVNLALLAELADEPADDCDLESLTADQASFGIFDQLLARYVPDLDPPNAGTLAKLLVDRPEEIHKAKTKCRKEAKDLVEMRGDVGLKHIRNVVDRLEEEVRAIAELDSASWRAFREHLLGDSGAWLVIAGAASATLGNPQVGGSIALSALAAAGAAALKTRDSLRKALSGSPWSVVYYLTRG